MGTICPEPEAFMIANKHISKIIMAITAVAVIVCFAAVAFASELTGIMGGMGVNMAYETRLFDTSSPIDLNIIMDEDQWDEMLKNAMSEEYYVCDVVINGTRINNVAIRPKGNTSLSAIAMDPDTDRYSLKLEFDHFVKGQTCFGLDKLILNNNYADATNMKEAVIYDMYQFIGADASLYNTAKISVNGEYWGVYLALEAVESSFMLRNFGTQDGELYKPDTMEMGGDSGSKGGGFSMNGSSGANLNYTDDDLDSYQTIWDSEITGTSKNDHRRVVTALKNISEGNDLETYLDVDNVLKYMAVHTFAVNMDSLSGSMSHNYYLYEYKGQLNIFPWDYNLSFGGMNIGMSADGTSMINDAVDTPFSGTKFFDALLENGEYLARYHEYLQMLADEYVDGGRFDETYNRIRSQIDTLVAEDPTAFYSADEYEVAAQMLYKTVKLRGESILGQINGSIPSTDAGQKSDKSSLIDGSEIDITAMGQFSMGGGGGFGGGSRGSSGSDEDTSASDGSVDAPSSGQDMKQPVGFDFGNMPDMGGFDPGNMPDMGDFDPGNMPDAGSFNPFSKSEESSSDTEEKRSSAPSFSGENMPSGMNGQQVNLFSRAKNVIVYVVCFVIAIAALLTVKLVKRKN
jgi:spore coat protein CotH